MKSFSSTKSDLFPSERLLNYNKDLSSLSLNYTPSKVNYPINIESKINYSPNNKIRFNENIKTKNLSINNSSTFNTTTSNNYFYSSNNNNYEYAIPSIESLEKKLLSFKENLRKENFNNCNQINNFPSNNNDNYMNNNNYFNSTFDDDKYKNKLSSLEKEKEMLMLKNLELENEIKKLDIMLNNNNRKSSNQIIEKNDMIYYNETEDSINKQNSKMKRQVNNLDKQIISLKNQLNNAQTISLKNNENNIPSTTYLEIQLWKQRCNQLADDYIKTLNNLKKELQNDKKGFKNAIQKIKKNFEKNINEMYNHYNLAILKNEKKIKILEKENSDLKEKEKKICEVYMYNFT